MSSLDPRAICHTCQVEFSAGNLRDLIALVEEHEGTVHHGSIVVAGVRVALTADEMGVFETMLADGASAAEARECVTGLVGLRTSKGE